MLALRGEAEGMTVAGGRDVGRLNASSVYRGFGIAAWSAQETSVSTADKMCRSVAERPDGIVAACRSSWKVLIRAGRCERRAA